VSDAYNDGRIVCDQIALRMRWYYPWGTKSVPYRRIKGVRRFEMTPLRGQWRIWGTGTFKYWANLDTTRPTKNVGLLIDVGKRVRPFITPDDADAVEAILRERARLGPDDGTVMPSPFI
jgi:hypothetical protein